MTNKKQSPNGKQKGIHLKRILIWFIALILTLAASRYQRKTGPTYPKQFRFAFQEKEYEFELLRTHGGQTDCEIRLILPEDLSGRLIYRRYPADAPWDTVQLIRSGADLVGTLPQQPPAGKLEYHVELFQGNQFISIPDMENVIIRFKGNVPLWALLPHVLFIFTSMLLSTVTGLYTITKMSGYKKLMLATILFFILGGFVFGPIVQKYAFDAFWTGWPNGQDLTDNKVLLALIPWLIAWIGNHRSDRRWLVVLASVCMVLVFLIPHSLRGSQLNYETGRIETGAQSNPDQ